MGAILFVLALAVITKKGLPLYTGLIGSRLKKAKTNPELRNYLVQILLFNLLGVLTLFLVVLSVQQKIFFLMALDRAAVKFSSTYIYILISSLICGVCVYLAVMSKDKLILILSVMTFILCDFRHCIAEAPFFFLKIYSNPSFDGLFKFILMILGNSFGAGFANHFLAKKQGGHTDAK